MKTLSFLLLTVVMAVSAMADNQPPVPMANDSINIAPDANQVDTAGSDQIVVYYLHMNRRCATCMKLEAYSREAIATGFADQLKDSSIVWRVANFESEGNEHFAKDYQLYSQSLILSRRHDGKETEWKNLDEIWKLVGDREKFIAYVQDEVRKFANPTADE